MARQPTLILTLCVAGAALTAWLVLGDGWGRSPGPAEAVTGAEAGPPSGPSVAPLTGRREAPEQPEPAGRTSMPLDGDHPEPYDPAVWEARLAKIIEEAPVGSPSEQPTSRPTLDTPGPKDKEIREILRQLTKSGLMDDAPFRILYAFGASDLPWLERLNATESSASQALSADMNARQVTPQGRWEEKDALYRFVRERLAAVASKRIAENPVAREHWTGRHTLSELPPSDPEARWIRSAIADSFVSSGRLFDRFPEILAKRDLAYVAPIDFEALRRISTEMYRAVVARVNRGGKGTDEAIRKLRRPFVERAAALLAGRRPR